MQSRSIYPIRAVTLLAAGALALLPLTARTQTPAPKFQVIILSAPPELNELSLEGIGNGQAAGSASGPTVCHAILWSADTHRPIDLHVAGCIQTKIHGAHEKSQVGEANGDATHGETHAVLWRGSARSAVDLNPEGVNFSVAMGCGGNQQVGFAHSGEPSEVAVLWSGTAQSAVNLHPHNFRSSRALATDGRHQVGS